MLEFVLTIITHLIPLILISIPFLILFHFHLKKQINNIPQKQEPNINELENKLNELIEQNNKQNQNLNLQKDLTSTTTNTISSYINLDKKHLKGFHLFQLIFSLIKNNSDDKKVLKILRHYLPSCSNSHLIAILHSFKQFLNISAKDNVQKNLLKDLYNNKVRSTLIYLEKKINLTINKLPYTPSSLHQIIINQVVIYSLIFASFSEFYNQNTTIKILKLSQSLSPELFKYWHSFNKTPPNHFKILNKYNNLPTQHSQSHIH